MIARIFAPALERLQTIPSTTYHPYAREVACLRGIDGNERAVLVEQRFPIFFSIFLTQKQEISGNLDNTSLRLEAPHISSGTPKRSSTGDNSSRSTEL